MNRYDIQTFEDVNEEGGVLDISLDLSHSWAVEEHGKYFDLEIRRGDQSRVNAVMRYACTKLSLEHLVNKETCPKVPLLFQYINRKFCLILNLFL